MAVYEYQYMYLLMGCQRHATAVTNPELLREHQHAEIGAIMLPLRLAGFPQLVLPADWKKDLMNLRPLAGPLPLHDGVMLLKSAQVNS